MSGKEHWKSLKIHAITAVLSKVEIESFKIWNLDFQGELAKNLREGELVTNLATGEEFIEITRNNDNLFRLEGLSGIFGLGKIIKTEKREDGVKIYFPEIKKITKIEEKIR